MTVLLILSSVCMIHDNHHLIKMCSQVVNTSNETLDPRRNQALKKMPLILGSGKRRSITTDFGMREVTELQETSVVTLGFQLPAPTCNSIWRWHLSPTSTTKGASLWSWPYSFLLPTYLSAAYSCSPPV